MWPGVETDKCYRGTVVACVIVSSHSTIQVELTAYFIGWANLIEWIQERSEMERAHKKCSNAGGKCSNAGLQTTMNAVLQTTHA